LGTFRYRKSASFLGIASPQIANTQVFIINPQIAQMQISTIYCTTLSQNNLKSCRFTRFFIVTNKSANITDYLNPQARVSKDFP